MCVCMHVSVEGPDEQKRRTNPNKKKKDDSKIEEEEGNWRLRALGAEMLQCLCGLPPRITENPLTDECRRAQ